MEHVHPDALEPLLIKLKGRGNPVKYLRSDRAGENKKLLGDECDKFGIIPELTAANTPQINGVVEREPSQLLKKERWRCCTMCILRQEQESSYGQRQQTLQNTSKKSCPICQI